jgi:hypothetical protein
MSGRTFHKQRLIRIWIDLYLEDNGMTSLQQIADYLKQRTNETVSRSTIARLVRDMGWNIKKGEWVKK